MGTSDGRVVGTTQILDSGPRRERYNVVVLGDGYQRAQLEGYAGDARAFVDALLTAAPFRHMSSGINVFRVDVESTDTGADDPMACGGPGTTARTYFDAAFCNADVRRLLIANTSTAIDVLNAQVPEWHAAVMIVNSAIYGGSGGQVGVYSLAPGAVEIALHEMGHSAFGLADEYAYWAGCNVDTDRNVHPPGEPGEPNVTLVPAGDSLKWGDLVLGATRTPTTENADCTRCDPQLSPVRAEAVGAFEGAHYYHCGAYRPIFDCRMRTLGRVF